MKKILWTTVWAAFVLLSLNSCSSTKALPVDMSNDAKELNAPEDKALVYVYRRSVYGAAIGLRVDVNQKELATFYPKRFYLCALDPGKYVFTGHGENEDDLILNLEAGKKYYIEVIPQMGWIIARCELNPVDQATGNTRLKKCKLIGLGPEAQKLLN